MTDDRPLKPQPRRVYGPRRPPVRQVEPLRYMTEAEVAALLSVTTRSLWRWRGRGIGPRLKLSPEGRRYDAREIEQLAALPYNARLMVLRRCRDI